MADSSDAPIGLDLLEIVELLLGVGAAVAAGELLISAAQARSNSFAAAVRHANAEATIELATVTRSIDQLLRPIDYVEPLRADIKDMLKAELKALTSLEQIDRGAPVVT